MFKITLKDLVKDKSYSLNFPPSHTVLQVGRVIVWRLNMVVKPSLQVKTDVSTVTDIPVYRQRWEGWPASTADHHTLTQTGIPREHTLRVAVQVLATSYTILISLTNVSFFPVCGEQYACDRDGRPRQQRRRHLGR